MALRPRLALVAGALALLTLLGLGAWNVHHRHPARDRSAAAYDVSETFVRQVLQQPGTATFSTLGKDTGAASRPLHNGDYLTTGWVQAGNLVGKEPVRDWRCIVHPMPGATWKLIYLHVDDFTFGVDAE